MEGYTIVNKPDSMLDVWYDNHEDEFLFRLTIITDMDLIYEESHFELSYGEFICTIKDLNPKSLCLQHNSGVIYTSNQWRLESASILYRAWEIFTERN